MGTLAIIIVYAAIIGVNGKNTYPKIVIDSAYMPEHTEAFEKNDYDMICNLLLKTLADLKAAGAELAAITANTEHIVWNILYHISDFRKHVDCRCIGDPISINIKLI